MLGLWLCVSCDSGNVLCTEYGMARFRHCVHSQWGLFPCNGRVGWIQVVPKNPNYLPPDATSIKSPGVSQFLKLHFISPQISQKVSKLKIGGVKILDDGNALKGSNIIRKESKSVKLD